MELSIAEENSIRFLEGPPEKPLMRTAEDAVLLVEACFSARVRCVLLYAPNLTERFFDLSSGEAGGILQKLRNYRIRLAVVCPPDVGGRGGRFGEMMVEENRGDNFRLFQSSRSAREWLAGTDPV